jgi:hypothetical protein
MIDALTIHQLRCFDAVVSEGSFQAAAEKLRRSQPTICSSIKNLETEVRISLLDRSGYRVVVTEAGRSFHERTRVFLQEFQSLRDHAAQLARARLTRSTPISNHGQEFQRRAGGDCRRRDVTHGSIAHRLWRYIEEQAPLLNGVGLLGGDEFENGASRPPAAREG